MIPFTTCIRRLSARERESRRERQLREEAREPTTTGPDGVRRVRPSIQVDVDIHGAEVASPVEEGARVSPSGPPSHVISAPFSESSMRAILLLRRGSSRETTGGAMSSLSVDEGEDLTRSEEEGRRRSSSSIRFADDTDTGTDILVITEEDLADILEDPIYGDFRGLSGSPLPPDSSPPLTDEAYAAIPAPIALQRRRTVHGHRTSLITSSVQRHLLLGVHGMSVGAAGAVVYPSRYIEGMAGPLRERGEETATRPSASRLLLTLRRRKSMAQTIHIDPSALLDFGYSKKVVERFLRESASWTFSTFSLDTLTGGHSLSTLLVYLFKFYGLVDHFNLDIVALWKCFHLFEQGYHDTNPYHNSVHAADVTQAMHCFLQEGNISPYLTPMEKMCALLAAVSHDLDHPGVNQHFLIATSSHLAALYNNLSVLESHHWRFAVSCIRESGVFDHFSRQEWSQIRFILRSLILATDITQQATYLAQFRERLTGPTGFISMRDADSRLFILKIALKCADLGNPCRSWEISRRWSEQICSEFYRQGDFERQLHLPITPICNRYQASMARIQTDFFRNVVTPLFELWDQFLSSDLSKQLITNLTFNYRQWQSFLSKQRPVERRHSMTPGVTIESVSTSESTTGSGATILTTGTLGGPQEPLYPPPPPTIYPPYTTHRLSTSRSLDALTSAHLLQTSSTSSRRPTFTEEQHLCPRRQRPETLSQPSSSRQPPPPVHHTEQEPHSSRHKLEDDPDDDDDPPKHCDGIHGCGTPSTPSSDNVMSPIIVSQSSLIGNCSRQEKGFLDDNDSPSRSPTGSTTSSLCESVNDDDEEEDIMANAPPCQPSTMVSTMTSTSSQAHHLLKSNSTEEEDEECISSEEEEEMRHKLHHHRHHGPGQRGHQAPPLPSHPFLTAPQYWGRRGSAPGCIGIYASRAELAAAALVFLSLNPRRSSAPVEGSGGGENSGAGGKGSKSSSRKGSNESGKSKKEGVKT